MSAFFRVFKYIADIKQMLQRSLGSRTVCCQNVQKTNFISNIRNRIPDRVRNRIRLIEVSGGKSALTGMLVGTVIENVQGKSFLTQFHDEQAIFWTTVVVMSALTILPNMEHGIEKKSIKHYGLWVYRYSMVAMTLIMGCEGLWQHFM